MGRRTSEHREYKTLGDNIKKLRAGLGWPQAVLADAADLSPSYLAEIEQGRRNPSLEVLWSLASALEVSVGELVDGPKRTTDTDIAQVVRLWEHLNKEARVAVISMTKLLAGKPHVHSTPEHSNRETTNTTDEKQEPIEHGDNTKPKEV